jgi:hypothetical protein
MSKASLELGGGNWAAKDGKLLGYAVGDTSGKYIPREFDFTRGGDIAATRVNEDGLIEKYRENLLLQSNQFDTTWTTTNASVTSGESGYDGSSDAWLLGSTGGLGRVVQSISQGGVQTLSFYAKAGTYSFARPLGLDSSTNPDAFFDLSTGTIASIDAACIDAQIEKAGGGWYRCSITYDTTISEARIYPAFADGDTSTYGGNIYIQDAQLEQGLVATDYLESGATTGKAGVLADLPRIDYTGGSASLLLEPERDNWVTQSEHLESSSWYKARCTIEDNSTTSPEGVVNASKMTSTDASESYIGHNAAITGTKATWSFFAKKGDLDYAHGLVWDTSANGCRQWFNLSTGEVGGTTTFGSGHSVDYATIEDYGNGWYRCAMVVNLTAGTQGFRVNISSADTTITSPVNSYGYFYGLQAEDASYPTSYIPTYGTSDTRNADFSDDNDIVGSPISFGANDDFTLFYEGSFDNLSSTSNMIMGGGNRLLGDAYKNYWWVQNATTIKITGDSEVLMASASMSLTNDTNHKLLVKRDGSTIDFFVDGSKLTTTQSAPNTAFVFRSLGWSYTNSVYKVSGNIKQALVFNSALTDAECIALTTL